MQRVLPLPGTAVHQRVHVAAAVGKIRDARRSWLDRNRSARRLGRGPARLAIVLGDRGESECVGVLAPWPDGTRAAWRRLVAIPRPGGLVCASAGYRRPNRVRRSLESSDAVSMKVLRAARSHVTRKPRPCVSNRGDQVGCGPIDPARKGTHGVSVASWTTRGPRRRRRAIPAA